MNPWDQGGLSAAAGGLLTASAIRNGDSWTAVALAVCSVAAAFYAIRSYRRSQQVDRAQ